MPFDIFRDKVNALVARAGGNISAWFFIEGGRYFARCSDGTTISANAQCTRVKVSWGSGHIAYATI